MVTHSRWRGDFSSLALAQSCAAATCAASNNAISARCFMAALPPDRKARNLTQSAGAQESGESVVGSGQCFAPFPRRDLRAGQSAGKRVWISLISNGGFADIPPPRVFCKKRLQAIENKGRELAKEGKEAPSLCKQKSWHVRRSERLNVGNGGGVHPPWRREVCGSF